MIGALIYLLIVILIVCLLYWVITQFAPVLGERVNRHLSRSSPAGLGRDTNCDGRHIISIKSRRDPERLFFRSACRRSRIAPIQKIVLVICVVIIVLALIYLLMPLATMHHL